MSVNMCPSDGLQSFPVDVGFALTKLSYTDATNEPLNIQFQWGKRTNPPAFSSAESGIIDHVENDIGTTITYNNQLFNLGSVQLTSPTHNRWIIPSESSPTKASNLEDIIFTYEIDTFAKSNDTDPKYLILVNPILRSNDPVEDPQYFTNFGNEAGTPVSLEGLFPYVSGNNYVYYTTCVPGNTLQSHYKNILVLLNTSGMPVSDSLMVKIKQIYNKASRDNYPMYIPLGNFSVKSSVISKVTGLTTMEGFQSTLGTVTTPTSGSPRSTTSGSPQSTTSGPTTRASGSPAPSMGLQSYNAMKCVPFDPERNLTKDGAIVIDTTKGIPFTLDPDTSANTMRNVLGALTNADGSLRYPNADGLSDEEAKAKYLQILPDNARNIRKNKFSMEHKGTIPFTSVENTLIAFCAIVMLIIIILLGINFMGKIKGSTDWLSNIWPLIEFFVFNIGLFVGGFFVGYFTLPASCP